MIAKDDKKDIVILYWLGTQYVTVLTTKHATEMDINANSAMTSQQENKQKPLSICEYSRGKAGIDISHERGSYATTLRKRIKWERNLAIKYVLEISVVNAYIIYKINNKSNIVIRHTYK